MPSGCEERSFVAILLGTDFLIGNLVNHNRDPYPVFFVNVASKRLSHAVSLLFAALTGRSINVAAKGVNAIVGSDPERVPTRSGSSIRAGQRMVVSEEKNRRRKLERDEWARIVCDSFRQGRNLPDKIKTGRPGLRANIHKAE